MMSDQSSQQKNQVDNSGRLSVLLQPKKVDWKAVQELLAAEAKEGSETSNTASSTPIISNSLCHQALSQACLDPTVCPKTLKSLLVRTNRLMSTMDKIQLAIKAARCDNATALRALAETKHVWSMLSWKNPRGSTLLHLVCAENGWNAAIAYLVDVTLEQQQLSEDGDHRPGGLFYLNVRDQCPLWLSLEAGANIAVILEHLRQPRYRLYLKQHLEQLSKVMAEYCSDMSALEQLVQDDASFLDGSADDASVYYACYYQNPNMIRFLLLHYQRRGDKRRKILKRLMTSTRTSTTRSRIHNLSMKTKAPLTCLVLGVGRSDPGNSIECIQACCDTLGTFPILHYTLEEALWSESDQIEDARESLSTVQCLHTVSRVIDHFQVDLLSLDDKKRTILSLLIMKQPVAAQSADVEHSIRAVLEYILSRCPDLAAVRDKRKRLPLHLAAESGWRWNEEESELSKPEFLAQLVQANPSALEVIDPKLKVFPFALATDLTTIFRLLRYQPAVVIGCR
jgi:hypothetical protein